MGYGILLCELCIHWFCIVLKFAFICYSNPNKINPFYFLFHVSSGCSAAINPTTTKRLRSWGEASKEGDEKGDDKGRGRGVGGRADEGTVLQIFCCTVLFLLFRVRGSKLL